MRRFHLMAMVVLTTFVPGAHALTIDELMKVVNVTGARIRPDGSAVAYAAARIDSTGRGWGADIFIVNVAGGDARRIATAAGWDDAPRWCPDGGGRLAFASDAEGSNQLMLIDADNAGGKASKLTTAANGVGAFAWSPDGTRIAYLSPGGETDDARKRREAGADVHIEDEPGLPSRIHIVDVTSGEDRELPALNVADVTTLDWPPTGHAWP